MSKDQSETKEVKMATKGKSKGGEKQQQSLSLGRETVEELEREAERRGLNKSATCRFAPQRTADTIRREADYYFDHELQRRRRKNYNLHLPCSMPI